MTKLLSLTLRNFRNYSKETLVFGPHLNIFSGDNGQGKTNLLEAIFLLSTGKSFRTAFLEEVIREGESFFYLEAEVLHHSILKKIQLFFDKKNRKVQIDKTAYPSFSSLLGTLPSVFHTPADNELFSKAPALRRRFLNIPLAQEDPLYVHHLLRFSKALKQRNCLLKTKKGLASIEAFEQEVASSGAFLSFRRKEAIDELQDFLQKCSKQFPLQKEKIDLHFLPSLSLQKSLTSLQETYREELKKTRTREMTLGYTLKGPHRDDFEIFIDKKPAQSFASDGQKKSLSSLLRFAEWFSLKEKMGEEPLFCMDDLDSFWDSSRQKIWQEALPCLSQVFLTTPSKTSSWNTEGAFLFHIEKGKTLQL